MTTHRRPHYHHQPSSSGGHAPPPPPKTPNKAAEGAAKAGFIPEDGSTCYGQVWEGDSADACEEMTAEEILTGKGDYFLGLIPLCNMYLDYIGWVRACVFGWMVCVVGWFVVLLSEALCVCVCGRGGGATTPTAKTPRAHQCRLLRPTPLLSHHCPPTRPPTPTAAPAPPGQLRP